MWRRSWRLINWGLVVYVILLFVLATLYLAGSIHWRMRMFIDDRYVPCLTGSELQTLTRLAGAIRKQRLAPSCHVSDLLSRGGPAIFYIEQFSQPETILSNSAYIFINFLADGLLVRSCAAREQCLTLCGSRSSGGAGSSTTATTASSSFRRSYSRHRRVRRCLARLNA